MFKIGAIRIVGTILLFMLAFCLVISLSFASSFDAQKIIGPEGGQLNVASTKLVIPPGALSEDTEILMEMSSDDESSVDFHFEPHGTVFAVPVELQLSWATLKDVDDPNELILYYYDEENDSWVQETEAVLDKSEKKATLYINHFSEYHFTRRSSAEKPKGKGKGK